MLPTNEPWSITTRRPSGVSTSISQKIRLDGFDQRNRGVLGEHDNQIDTLQRSQYGGTRRLVLNRTGLSLEPTYRIVVIETDNQPVAGSP